METKFSACNNTRQLSHVDSSFISQEEERGSECKFILPLALPILRLNGPKAISFRSLPLIKTSLNAAYDHFSGNGFRNQLDILLPFVCLDFRSSSETVTWIGYLT